MKNSSSISPTGLMCMSVNTGRLMRLAADNKQILRGYAVVFDDTYKHNDWWSGEDWTERIDPKAFDGVDMSNVVFLRDHNFERLLGRAGKNLRIEVDDKGIFFEIELPDTELARETYALAGAEICDQCSFGFTIKEFKRDLGNKIDTITKIDRLYELTITPIPAYKSTVVITMSEKRHEIFAAEEQKRTAERQAAEAEKKALQEAQAEKQRLEAEEKNLREAERDKLLQKLRGES